MCEVIFLMTDSYFKRIITDHLYSTKACKIADFAIIQSEGIEGFTITCEIEKTNYNDKYFPGGNIDMNLIDKEIEVAIGKTVAYFLEEIN